MHTQINNNIYILLLICVCICYTCYACIQFPFFNFIFIEGIHYGLQHIRKTKSDVTWLICFYIGDTGDLRDLNLQMKKFSTHDIKLGRYCNFDGLDIEYKIFLHSIKYYLLGKINCGRNGQLCSKLGINRYPMWGMLKPGGAFELHHGNNLNNDIIKFVQISVKTTNVWTLSAEEALSILQRKNGIISNMNHIF